MSIYVDDMKAPFGNMLMCHLIADTHEELVAMADKIGVAQKWLQNPGTHKEHFDICLSKRAKAIQLGATELTVRELATLVNQKKYDSNHKTKP